MIEGVKEFPLAPSFVMNSFEPSYSSVEKDIERYLDKYGVHDTLEMSGRKIPVIRGYDAAQRLILDKYYERQAYDPLVAFLLTFNWELGNGELLLELSDALARKKDARRLKRLWQGVIAKQKMHFRHYQALPDAPPGLQKAKATILGTLDHVREIMLQLGEAQEAQRLDDDKARIEKGERGKPLPKPLDRLIDEDCFWEIIETAKNTSSSTDQQIELLTGELERFKATEIKKFDKLLRQKMAELYHWDIWAVAYLAQGGCSDDAFEAFRPWLILQGRKVYKLALDNVSKLAGYVPQGLETQAEGLLFAAALAYENRSGKPLQPAKEKAPKIKGKPWEDAELQSRYPELYKRYS